jgi:hypothetical protein
MSPLSIQDLRIPYDHVVVESTVRVVQRLLITAGDGPLGNSVTLSGLSRSSILDLAGLGRELWQGVDPVQYVRELRDEWEPR